MGECRLRITASVGVGEDRGMSGKATKTLEGKERGGREKARER